MNRVVKWDENQIALVAKLRSHFQNQIAIAKNCDFLILNLKITQKLESCNEWIWWKLLYVINYSKKYYFSFKNVSTALYGQFFKILSTNFQNWLKRLADFAISQLWPSRKLNCLMLRLRPALRKMNCVSCEIAIFSQSQFAI